MEWFKDIPGYEGLYAVDVIGNVFSYRAKRLLALCHKKSGHICVSLGGGSNYNRYVHQLVLETFMGPRPSEKHISRHLNGDPSDNSIFNLEWSTRIKNGQDIKWHNGTNKKLSVTQVREIKGLIALKISNTKIAPLYGVTPTTISQIKCGMAHADV